MNSTQELSLAKMAGLVEVFRQLDADMAVPTILVFLTVAQSMPEGIMLHELSRKLGLSGATGHRNVSFLTKERTFGVPGYDLLVSETVPQDRRQRRVRLTAKGEKFLAKLIRQLE